MVTGFNSDVTLGGSTYHVQTEDKGAESGLIETLVYRAGRILAARRLRPTVAPDDAHRDSQVAHLMQRQHQAIVTAIRSGRLRVAADVGRRRRRILVIDDDPDALAFVERILSNAGHQALPLRDPRLAVEVARAGEPDLVLCDLAMPGLNGYGVVRALSAQPDTERLPVAFLTAEHDLEQRVNAFRFGVVEYLTKPIRAERLIQALDTLFESLAERPGATRAPRADHLLEDVRREGRSGTLKVRSPAGDSRVVVSAGEVVEGPDAAGTGDAEFEELDFDVEAVLARDPSRPVEDGGPPPSFAEINPALRVVLLVDANAQFRRQLASAIEPQGFRVLEADDATAAEVLIHEEWPWVVVTDTRLPDRDGFELCRRIRTCPCHSRLPVLFLSGWHDPGHQARGLAAGGDHYLSKLMPVRQVLVRLRMILSRFDALAGARGDESFEAAIHSVGVLPALRLIHLARRTGVLALRSGERIIEVRVRDGQIVGADSDASSGLDALTEALPWTHGELGFDPGEIEDADPLGPFEALLASLCRRLCGSERRE